MSEPPVVGAGDAAVQTALLDDKVIVLPGVGSFQLAARHGGRGVAMLVALADARAPDLVPYLAVGRIAQIGPLTAAWTKELRRLVVRFWPGPLIVIMGDTDESVRITMPAGRSLRALCRQCGPLVMVAAPDADGRPLSAPDRVQSAFTDTEVALVVDGDVHEGPGASVLDCRVTPPAIYEEGALPATFIVAALAMNTRRRWMSRS
jgi:tRNA A37 threonylcarbamoyladenosine synthetase subunit TsaC/SUA5/YrdC